MFKAIAEEHEKQIKIKQKAMKELENKIVDNSLPAYGEALFNQLNNGSEQIVQNQKEIDRKCKEAKEGWEKFSNELGKWTNIITDFEKAIKDIGDVKTWAESIQSQVDKTIEKLSV